MYIAYTHILYLLLRYIYIMLVCVYYYNIIIMELMRVFAGNDSFRSICCCYRVLLQPPLECTTFTCIQWKSFKTASNLFWFAVCYCGRAALYCSVRECENNTMTLSKANLQYIIGSRAYDTFLLIDNNIII